MIKDSEMHILQFHLSFRKLSWIVVLTMLIFSCSCMNLQHQINQPQLLTKENSVKRNLQSSYLGFDLSFFSTVNGASSLAQTSTVTFQPATSQPIVAAPININQQPQTKNSQTTNQPKTVTSPNQPLNYQKISNNQFSSVTLYHNIPIKFLLNQIYTFKGTVINPSATKVNVLFSLVNDPSVRMTVSQSLNGKKQFQVPFTLSISGKFYLTIFTGSSGDSSRTQYEVIERPQFRNYDIEAPPQLDNLVIFQKDNKICVKWNNINGQKYPIVKLTFQQFSTKSKVQFILSNFVNQFTLPLRAFSGFEKSTVSLAAVQAKSSTSSVTSRLSQFSIAKMIFFDPQQHNFSQNREDLVQFDDFGYIFNPQQGTINIKGKALSKLKNEVLVLQPSKTFRSYMINNTLSDLGEVPANSNIDLSIDISQQGVYIIEINHNSGVAVLNRPVYVGRNIIPMIPDSQDLKDTSRSPSLIVSQQPRSIDQQRNLFLGLINAKRAEFGLEEVYLDDKLNLLAQQHSQDMVRRSYSSHYTPQGLSPTDRARNNKIYQQIGQNIGQNSDLIDTHNRLCRSNIHLRNIVRSKWVRVGLGIKLNSNNSFIVTQQFSTKDLSKDPLTQSQLNAIKTDVISHILYSARVVRSENIDLSQKIATWHQQRLSATSSQLSNFIGSLKYPRYSGVVIKLSYSSQATQSIKNSPYLLPSSNTYTQVGMSIKFNNGLLQVYIGYVA